MLTYTPPDPRRPQKTHEKPWLLLLMAFAWLWPGVFSHDLWNPAEPSLFTASESMKNGGSLLVAQIFGQSDFTISPAFCGRQPHSKPCFRLGRPMPMMPHVLPAWYLPPSD